MICELLKLEDAYEIHTKQNRKQTPPTRQTLSLLYKCFLANGQIMTRISNYINLKKNENEKKLCSLFNSIFLINIYL
jgi:hypothetical protein